MTGKEVPVRVRAYASLYLSATVFALTSVMVKFASAYYSGLFISSVRFALGTILCLSTLFLRYGGIRITNWRYLALRGGVGVVAMVLGYVAIGMTGPGRATLLINTYPLFVVIFGALAFGETFRLRDLASIALCVAGAAMVVRDGSRAPMLGDLLALVSAVFSGLAVNAVRKLAPTENPFTIYLAPCVFGLVLFLVAPVPADPLSGGIVGLLLLLGVGAFSFLGQALMAYGYKEVSAGSGSIVFYWETALTIALGVLLAGERMNLAFFAGLALILAGLRLNQIRSIKRRAV